jgi:Mu transposase, C-terminal domain
VMKDCLISYEGNRYSVLYLCAGTTVTMREMLDGAMLRIFHRQDRIAEHLLARGKSVMVMEATDYRNPPRRNHAAVAVVMEPVLQLVPGPGVGLHHRVPEVELRPLTSHGGRPCRCNPNDCWRRCGGCALSYLPACWENRRKLRRPRICRAWTFSKNCWRPESSAKHARNVWLKEALGALSLQQGAGAVRL